MSAITWKPSRFLDLELAMARYRRWGRDPVNVWEAGTYSRVASGSVAYSARARPDGSIEVTSKDAQRGLEDLQYRLAESLPYEPLRELAQRNRYVAGLVEDFAGYRPPLVVDPFEMLVGAISAQQVNLRWANTVRGRLVEGFGRVHEVQGTEVWEFPRPERIAEASVQELHRLQFTRAKSEAIIGLAKAAAAGELDALPDLSNEEVVERTTALRGIGRWTADWLLARGLGRPDVVAAGDLGVRKAVSHLYLSADELRPEEEIRDVAGEWGNAANLTAHLLLERLARS